MADTTLARFYGKNADGSPCRLLDEYLVTVENEFTEVSRVFIGNTRPGTGVLPEGSLYIETYDDPNNNTETQIKNFYAARSDGAFCKLFLNTSPA